MQYKQKQTKQNKIIYFELITVTLQKRKKIFFEDFDVFFFPYVGNCYWFSPLFREVFLRVLRFSLSLKANISKFQFYQE